VLCPSSLKPYVDPLPFILDRDNYPPGLRKKLSAQSGCFDDDMMLQFLAKHPDLRTGDDLIAHTSAKPAKEQAAPLRNWLIKVSVRQLVFGDAGGRAAG
jgi:hypothetical protein